MDQSDTAKQLDLSFGHSPDPDQLGTFAQYEIKELLGRGGMGVVYKAWDTQLKRTVALKLIHSDTQSAPEENVRFRREAEAIARLQHPNIVQIFEVGEFGGTPFLALEYVDGGSLAARLDGTPWSALAAAALLESLAQAMHVAHQAGVVHRDLKPSNILISEVGTGNAESTKVSTTGVPNDVVAKISDFGLAKLTEATQGQTESGVFMGTPSYCAPEQAAGKARVIGPRSDVYALGAILYELVTGRPPFRGASMVETLSQVVNHVAVAPRLLNSNVPWELETVCLKCLEKSPERRYASASELAADLRRWLNNEPIHAKPSGPWGRFAKWVQRRPTAAALTGVSAIAVVAVIGLLVGSFLYSSLQEQKSIADAQRMRAERANTDLQRTQYNSAMVLADRAWEENGLIWMHELLDGQNPKKTGGKDLRGFEWFYLWGLCHHSESTIRTYGRVMDCALSKDGSTLALTSAQHIIRIWDLAQLKERFGFRTRRFLHRIALSPDCKYVAGGHNGILVLYEAGTGETVFRQTPEIHKIRGVVFHPDGKSLFTCGMEGCIKRWHVPSGRLLQSMDAVQSLIVSNVAVSPDGKWLAASKWSPGKNRQGKYLNGVSIWDMAGKEIKTLKGHAEQIRHVTFDTKGQRLAAGSNDGFVTVWNLKSGERLLHFQAHEGAVNSLAFGPKGQYLASGGTDKTAKIWDLQNGGIVRTFKGHTDSITQVRFHSAARKLITSGNDHDLKIWDLQRPAKMRQVAVPGPNDPEVPFVLCTNGQLVARGNRSHVEIWNLDTGKIGHLLKNQNNIRRIALSRDGKRAATLDTKNEVRVWIISKQSELLTLEPSGAPMAYIALSPDGKRLATGSKQGDVQIWSTESGAMLHQWNNLGGEVRRLTFDPKGTRLAAAVPRKNLYILNAATGGLVRRIKCDTGWSLSCMDFSADGERLAFDQYNLAEVWNVQIGKKVQILRGHTERMESVSLSPDNKRIATASHSGYVRIWDVTTGQLTLTLNTKLSGPWHVQFSDDGRRLICGCERGVVLWDAATPAEVAEWNKRIIRVPKR